MVDFRPLLFLNALALMLLVTAGFASVRDPTPTPIVETVAETAIKPEATPEQPAVRTEPFSMPQLPEEPLQVASAEPLAAMADYTAAAQKPAPEEAPAPTTGALILRSNVVGDHVEINGKAYGQTRLDLELAPGKYDITISKAGFKPWQQTVALDAGNELTLVGKLEAYTTVNYQNGSWIGGVKTGDGTYEDSDGLKYEGHFIDGAFHGAGTAWYPDGSRYEGDFSNGTFHGSGSEVFASGKKYEGEYIEGKFHGNGLLSNPNGSSIEATFRHGEPYGQVRLTTAAGELFTARTSEPGVCYRDKSYRATQCPKLEGW